MKNLDDYKDKLGFIGHRDDLGYLEFGDGTQRIGFYFLPLLFKNKINPSLFLNLFRLCFILPPEPLRYPGEPYRKPDELEWYAKPGTMSRDNFITCFCVLTFLGRRSDLVYLIKRLIKRFGFMWNTKHIGQQDDSWKIPDWCGLSMFGLFLRGYAVSYDSSLLYILSLPILIVIDAFLLLSIIFRLFSLYLNADNCGDCLNNIALLSTIKETHTETPFSFIARLVYSGLHPGAGPNNRERIRGYGPLTSLQHYFNGIKNPPIDEVWREYLLQEF